MVLNETRKEKDLLTRSTSMPTKKSRQRSFIRKIISLTQLLLLPLSPSVCCWLWTTTTLTFYTLGTFAVAFAIPATVSSTTNLIMTSTLNAAPTTTTTAGVTSSSTTSTPPAATTLHPHLASLAVIANAYAAAHGIQVERKMDTTSNSNSGVLLFQGAPLSLLPNAYPRAAFQCAVDLAPAFNVLVDRVSRNAEFLTTTLQDVVTTDPYTAQLLRLYQDIYVSPSTGSSSAPAREADRLGILRSDYMLHPNNRDSGNGEYEIKQVELNTIASSFAGLASQVAALHSYLLRRYNNNNHNSDPQQARTIRAFLQDNQIAVTGQKAVGTENSNEEDGVPVNPAMECLPAAMHMAVQRYRERHNIGAQQQQPCCVLFVVQEGETNTVDQRLLEFQLFERHQIPVVRKSLRQVHAEVKVNDRGALLLRNDSPDDTSTTEIALVYFRAGYAPTDYPSGSDGVEWQARERLERSRATKCPSLGYHLAGTKKVQQQLARPDVLERFFPNEPDQVQALRRAFAGLYSLGPDAVAEDMAAVQEVLDQPDGPGRYVLKPQREGGGYNFYGPQLKAKLQSNVTVVGSSETTTLDPALSEYILMERLFPPKQNAILLRGGRVEGQGDTISELGCFGCIVASSEGQVVHNEYAGFLLRTKFSNVDEGGVASGFATLSSPYLC